MEGMRHTLLFNQKVSPSKFLSFLHPANAPEGFCIETMVVGTASEHRLCKKDTHMGSAEQRIVG